MSVRQLKNSTIVRAAKWGARSLAARSLHTVSPQLAAAAAARWFLEPEDLGLAAVPSGSAFFIHRDGLELAARSWGRGPAVLLVHGWNGRGDQLAAVATAIAELGFRAVAFDLPGHGASAGNEVGVPLMARSVAAVAEVIDPVAIVAHSLGATAVTAALAGGIEVGRVAFVAPPIDPSRWITRLTKVLGLPRSSGELVAGAVESRVGVPIATIDPLTLAPSMSAELLVVHDRDDREVPLEAGMSYVEAWPRASLLLTRGLGHARLLNELAVATALAIFATGGSVADATRVLAAAQHPPSFEPRDAHMSAVVDAVAEAI